LIIGADNYDSFDKWKNHEEIKSLCELVVVNRNGHNELKKDGVKQLNVDIDISSSQLRSSLTQTYIPKKIRKNVKKIWQEKGLNIGKM